MNVRILTLILSVAISMAASDAHGDDSPGAKPAASGYSPRIAPASEEAERAMAGFRLPAGMRAELVAAEPLLANPVAFCFDERGRIYVAETFRQSQGVVDNRGHMHWLHDDLAAETIADRLAYFRKHLGNKIKGYATEHDRIRLLFDRDGDGRYESSTVFADGFNQIEDGTGAGVLARDGNVYYTCIPKLYRLNDTSGDGVAETRETLHDGYGVRVAFRGHDMHGLTVGYDGRLYYSIGDRGYNVISQEARRFKRPDTGAVFRCEMDGSQLEVFAYGLRNPQELAFDDFGNLFTGDNNSDSGDRARWVYVVEGGDSGWRMQFQYLPDRGPWNRERMWYPYRADDATTRVQPAHIVPPIANLGDGPSGLVFYPGVGLPDRYRGHFFMVDFRGSPQNSGIRSFAVEPRGASFELADSHEFIWSILATDVDFGYEGNLYVSDWVNGWEGEGKGRIYRFPHADAGPEGAQTATLFRDGFAQRSVEELRELLSHADRRVRLEAQFALVKHVQSGKATPRVLLDALDDSPRMARIHAVWGMGQLLRSQELDRESLDAFLALHADGDDEIRAQLARVAGECRQSRAVYEILLSMLRGDASTRVKSLAAISLGRLSLRPDVPIELARDAVDVLLAGLAANQNADTVLRHAYVMGLTGVGQKSPQLLAEAVERPSHFERLGVLLALRRLHDPLVSRFLSDPEPDLVLEAARAINDEPIDALTPALAALIGERAHFGNDALMRRAINASFRLGDGDLAAAVARLAADATAPSPVRLEAARAVKDWNAGAKLDRVLGSWRPVDARDVAGLVEHIKPHIGGMLSGSDELRGAAIELASVYGISDVVPTLRDLFGDRSQADATRVSSLRALRALQAEGLRETASAAYDDPRPLVRAEGLALLAELLPAAEIVPRLLAAIEGGSIIERQSAVRVLGRLKDEAALQKLREFWGELVAGRLDPAIRLDLYEAARGSGEAELVRLAEEFETQRQTEADPLRKFSMALVGGDAERGRDIFFGRSEASCLRCHSIGGAGGIVGPELTRIGVDKQRDYLLEAIVAPNAKIAKGFETAVLLMEDGKVHTGIVKAEDDRVVTLMLADGALLRLNQSEIEERAQGKSGMPEDVVKQLSLSDIRDLVEFLSALRGTPPPAK